MIWDNCCTCPSEPASVTADFLANFKQWTGTLAYWMNIGRGVNGPNPSVSQRQDFRRRYKSAEVDVASGYLPGGGPGYVSTWDLQGAGLLPTNSGMPRDIFGPNDYLGAIGNTQPDMFPLLDAVVFGGKYLSLYPGFLQFTNGGFSGASKKGFLLRSPDDQPPDTLSIQLSGESNFADELSVPVARLFSRGWPAFSGGSYLAEVFGEYQGSALDGAWHAQQFIGTSNPFFKAATGGAISPFLWSGWNWPTPEEGGDWVDLPYRNFIQTQRCRFVASTATPYFFASATINRLPGWGPAPNSSDSIVIDGIIAEDTTVPGQIYEIPFPDGSTPGRFDFVASPLAQEGLQTLSCGACVFAIVGETVATWAARPWT